MTEAEVARIEARLKVVLPPHYRSFVLAYPRTLLNAALDMKTWQEPAAESFLFNDPKRVIDINRAVREPGRLMLDGESEPWPGNYLIVGADGGGNYWCVDLEKQGKTVWFFDHEQGAFEQQSKSLPDFVKYVLKYIEPFNSDG